MPSKKNLNLKNTSGLLTACQESAQAFSADAFAIDNMVGEGGAGQELQLLERMFATGKSPDYQRRQSNVTFAENTDLVDFDKLLLGKLQTALGTRRSTKKNDSNNSNA